MPQPALSESERLELAAKLDRELDDFIDSLPRREPQEPVAFERWEEEIANHPFFMKEAPEPGSAMHPLYEGLQKLKYDPDENEPEELASAYKEDGNFHFKHKKYRMAIISYTEGLKAKSGNRDLDASLYNNRSAAHFFLKNYRSSLMDAESALKSKPGHDKALIRAANCCYKMEKFDKVIEFCDLILEKDKENREILELRKKSVNENKSKERNQRKRELAARKLEEEEEKLVENIKQRGIRIEGGSNHLTLTKLEPQFPQLFNSRVSINSDGNLSWPVVFFYPEYKIMDYVQEFDESVTFREQLGNVFSSYAPWDQEKKYTVGNLSVYFENSNLVNVKIDVNQTLLEVLKLEGHVIKEGTPKFIILVANSKVEKSFLERR